jgi:hypothetical protein
VPLPENQSFANRAIGISSKGIVFIRAAALVDVLSIHGGAESNDIAIAIPAKRMARHRVGAYKIRLVAAGADMGINGARFGFNVEGIDAGGLTAQPELFPCLCIYVIDILHPAPRFIFKTVMLLYCNMVLRRFPPPASLKARCQLRSDSCRWRL